MCYVFCADDILDKAVNLTLDNTTQVLQNQAVSIILESIISAASSPHLRTLFVAFTSDLSVSFFDNFGSHVMERLLQRLPHFFISHSVRDHLKNADEIYNEDENISQEQIVKSLDSIYKFVDEQFRVILLHTYGCHVFRALMEGLSGVSVVHKLKKGVTSLASKSYNFSEGVFLLVCT